MSGPVDVLVVMNRALNQACSIAGQYRSGVLDKHVEDLREARAAIAELIEANRYYDDAQFGLARARYNSEPLDQWVTDCAQADIRRAKALARVQP